MRLAALLDVPDLRLRLLTGADRLDREVRHTITTDLLDPGRFLSGGELVLTGLMWWQRPADTGQFLGALKQAGVAGLVVGSAGIDVLPARPAARLRAARRTPLRSASGPVVLGHHRVRRPRARRRTRSLRFGQRGQIWSCSWRAWSAHSSLESTPVGSVFMPDADTSQ